MTRCSRHALIIALLYQVSLIPAAFVAALAVGINLLVDCFPCNIGGQIAREMLE
jgi:hypothetical protein